MSSPLHHSQHHQQTVTGYIVAVEEERFRLQTDNQQNLVLTASNGARAQRRLQDWHRTNAHLRITYTGEPNLATGVAKSIVPLANGRGEKTGNSRGSVPTK